MGIEWVNIHKTLKKNLRHRSNPYVLDTIILRRNCENLHWSGNIEKLHSGVASHVQMILPAVMSSLPDDPSYVELRRGTCWPKLEQTLPLRNLTLKWETQELRLVGGESRLWHQLSKRGPQTPNAEVLEFPLVVFLNFEFNCSLESVTIPISFQ